MMTENAGQGPVVDIVDHLSELAGHGEGSLTVGDINRMFGDTSFLPVMVVPALIVFSPLSGIPLLPSMMGLMIALVAGQMVARRRNLWLPGWISHRRIRRAALVRMTKRVRPWAAWVDRRLSPRLSMLAAPPLDTIPRLLCMLSGLAMPFLELVPFSSSILALAVLFLSVGMLSRDGAFIIGGAVVVALATILPISAWFLVAMMLDGSPGWVPG